MGLSRRATRSCWRTRGGTRDSPRCAPLAVLLAVAVLLVTGESALAQTRDELRAAMRRLGQVGSSLEALPNTAITRDAGQIAIIEHDGSSYDQRLADGTLNYEARIRVGRRFYESHADEYDFLVVFTNFEFETGDATAFHLFGRNDVEGIGKYVGTAPVVFGSPARLKGWIDMAAVSRYRARPFSVTPGDRGLLQTLNVLGHEMGHQWLAEATYARDGARQSDLLGRDGVHWSSLLDSDASLLYGADWRDDGDGTFTAVRVKDAYSALDLYLMGFLPKEKVPPFLLLRSPGVDPKRIDEEGDVVVATGTTQVRIDQLVDDMGPRKPGFAHSQKEFRLGFVLLTKAGTEPSLEDLEAVEQIRRAFGAHFFALTHGVAWADTTLVESAAGPRAAEPDLQRALAWLGAQQAVDGSWSDSAETRPRDTAAATWALATAGASGAAWQRGLAWLQQGEPESLDYRARLTRVLAGALTAGDRAAREASLLSSQNADGGFGAGPDFTSDALDTALALRALHALGHPGDGHVRKAVGALAMLASPDGGWPAVAGGDTSTVATAEVLLALEDWRETPGASALVASGLAALLARQNPDGGFGSSPSTAHATALALEVLLGTGGQGEWAAAATAWLEASQLANGSWADSPYQTALVLSALRQSLGPNLVVPVSTLVVVPNPVEEGQPVQVGARVRNVGRAGAPATVARLYDGDPASTPAKGEATVPALAPGEEAEVSFVYPTGDRAGSRTLYVVADAAAAVPESREDDNTASTALAVAGRLADLQVGPGDITASPAGPEVGEAASIRVTVRNLGERAAAASAVLVTVTDPSQATAPLPLAALPALSPGEAATVTLAWTPAVAGVHVVRAAADAHYEVPESDETNGAAERSVRVLDGVPDGPELAVRHASATPAALEELPQSIDVTAVVENVGRASAGCAVAVVDGRTGERVGASRTEASARSSTTVSVHAVLSTAGARQLLVVGDPDGEVPEGDETDNWLSIPFPDAGTRDLEVSAASPSATDVAIGERVDVTVGVRNRGTVDVAEIPLQLAHDVAGAPAELARATLSLAAGESRSVVLSWRASITGEAVPLLVRIDPFDLVPERREDNNAASLAIRVRPSDRPNLAVSGADVTIQPDPPVEGDSALVAAVVRNTSVAPAGSFAVRFVVGDPDRGGTAIGEARVEGLAAGESRAVSVTWPRVGVRGSLGLYVIADADAEVDESDEDDNRGFRPFQATGLPDLVLTAADVTLEPGYPRAGEPVTIRATVRNLGGLPTTAPTTLAVAEGEGDARVEIGTISVPPQAPGAFVTLSLPWAPAAPAGARALSLALDPEDLLREQDEGNNQVVRTVVVQDADLYLTEPVFSPDGDGVKDETTLAWRATGHVDVVVSDARGAAVRTLVEDGPESGSATWDGRDAGGLVAWDGPYTASLVSVTGQVLGTVPVVLDTNRSPIHDAAPGRTTIRNLTCAVGHDLSGAAWLPNEEEVLYVDSYAPPGSAGLLRVGVDGSFAYLARDEWYRLAGFAGSAPVSSDGRGVLVRRGSEVFLVDLPSGERRSLASLGYYDDIAWSPDGRFVLAQTRILARDGSVVADVGPGRWAWSPASDRLATGEDRSAGVALVARDGAEAGFVELSTDFVPQAVSAFTDGVVWRRDGKIVANVTACAERLPGEEAGQCAKASFVVDPDSLTATRLPFVAEGASWSPDGSRLVMGGTLYLASGTSLGPLLPAAAAVSPGGGAATFSKQASETGLPGSVCGGKQADDFVISSGANLAAQLDVARLPGNGGLAIRGTASDRNLERFQLDYASQAEPTAWHPIGAALDVPVLDDGLTTWVPPGPGTYLVRLSVSDLAGHAAVRTRIVSWDRVPVLANFTQSDYYLSADETSAKHSVVFRYTVLSPTRVDVRVVGPEPAEAGGPAGREVWRTAFEYPAAGPQSFSWDARDAAGQVVPDGRYTVSINDLPFRVEVDSTPPEVGLRFEDLHVAPALVSIASGSCEPAGPRQGGSENVERLSSVAADRAWHVFDERLRSWVFRHGTAVIEKDTAPVFVAEEGAVAGHGSPPARRENGRVVDRRDEEYVLRYSKWTDLLLEAWDLAGNHSSWNVDRPDEAVFALGAAWAGGCETAAEMMVPQTEPGQPVNPLKPENVVLQAGTTLRLPADQQDLRLLVQPVDGGPERELPLETRDWSGHRNVAIASFEDLGFDATRTYQGRFRGEGESGDVVSAPFAFCPCRQWLRAFHLVAGRSHLVVAQLHLDSPAADVSADVSIVHVLGPPTPVGTLRLSPLDAATAHALGIEAVAAGVPTFFALLPDAPIDCANRMSVSVRARDAAGKTYPSREVEKSCQKLEFVVPEECRFGLSLTQQFPGCSGSPDVLHVAAGGYADRPGHVTIEAGPVQSPTILDSFDFVPAPYKGGFGRAYEVSVEGYSGETYALRGRVVPLDPAYGEGARASLSAIVDRAPPVGEILLPPEGGSVCLARDDPAPPLQTLARVDDASPQVTAQAFWRREGGAWKALPRLCDAACAADPDIPVGRPFPLEWNGAELDSGWYDLQLQSCDRSGNKGSTSRRVLVTRDVPTLLLGTVLHPVFSPNGDGQLEDVQATVRLAQAGSLSVRVRAGSAQGPVVRTLWTDVPETATDVVVAWDGRGDDGRIVPDGAYWLVFSLADACGGSSERSSAVAVDTVPPDVSITEPTGGQRVSASVDVLGRATDPHLATWTLDVSCGASAEWRVLATKGYPVAGGSFLARWDTSKAPPGECRLRLVAEDQAKNRSSEALATAAVERGDLLDGLSATPDVFSPNGDGRRDTATLGYGLQRAARVRLEVRDEHGVTLRAFETGEERPAGSWSHVWDGLDGSAKPAADGVLLLWVHAEDPAVATVYEEKSLRFVLDRTPPAVTISRPAADGFVAPTATVRGSVDDSNLALFTVSVAPAGSASVELGRGSQATAGEGDLAPLSSLAEGPHVLRVVATDTAENETTIDRSFFVDSTPPRVAIRAPASGAVLRGGATPIPVTGLVADDHLEQWTLRFGAGAQPLAFTSIAQGQAAGEGATLGAWPVQSVPDGIYTLSLVATDRAGSSSESRVVVTLDHAPPDVALTSPLDGGYVTKPGPITGTASDANLSTWQLDFAPGTAAAAYRWSPLAAGSAPATRAPLAEWSPLPPDGAYTLRLTARDEVGLTASARATVTVDTTPPAVPTGLAAKVTRTREGYGQVVLSWNASTEADLAGYRVGRPREECCGSLLGAPAWDDGERVEGSYTYEVLAEDKAGNQSPPATIQVRVDLTPPLVSLATPAEGASVAGAVEVRGTAWSADDFADYRLLVSPDGAPPQWTTLRRSSVAVAGETLGEWLAVQDGPYVLALEAEDTSGNVARVTRHVTVDTVPPEPPVLVAVAKDPAVADRLVPSWQASPSADVIGTLVYRNGRLANSVSAVLGDRSGLVVPGTSYPDDGLPDGQHCYRVCAMDAAGNESAPSLEICQSLDNRSPRAVITNPPAGTRFGYPVRVVAEVADLDVASVRFERRADGSGSWVAFGEALGPTWETTLDPKPPGGAELAAGAHDLRAVATDRAGNTDPDPARVTVVYGDTTPPPAPGALVARVDGWDVTLAWAKPDAPDVATYDVYRDGERIAGGLSEPSHADPGRPAGTWEYAVTAVDADGNESAPSGVADAVVYAVSLEQPVFPVVGSTLGSVSGTGSRPQTTMKVLRDGAAVAQSAANGTSFRVEGVPLLPDGNALQARGEDPAGNRSVVSNEVVLVSNAAPGPVAQLQAEVDGSAVSLQWTPATEPDVVGYVVRRDGERLTQPAPQREAATIDATDVSRAAELAFDGDPSTAWVPALGAQAWTVTFPKAVLLERVRLRFAQPDGANPGIAAGYTLLGLWQDRYLPLVRVRGNTQLLVDERLPAPFLTRGLRVSLDLPGGLAEVAVERLDVVPTGTESFDDHDVPDGRRTYEVAAIDRYGAEGAPGSVEAAVGDVDAPGRPTGLVATPVARDVRLAWNASPEPDVEHYVVLRDGSRIGRSETPAYVDLARPDGTWRYAVTAVDEAGHESDPSDPADATVAVQPVAPAAPAILEPTDAANPIALSVSRADVAGRADPGSVVSLEVDGEPAGTVDAGPGFRTPTSVSIGAAEGVVLSPDGRWASWSEAAGTVSVQDLGSDATRVVSVGTEGAVEPLAFSSDGTALALARRQAASSESSEIDVLRLADDSLGVLVSGAWTPGEAAWSPDDARLAVSVQEPGGGSLQVVDLVSGVAAERARSSGVDTHLRWSPDGSRIAFIRNWGSGVAAELQVLDLRSSRSRVLDSEPWPEAAPSWSADGRRLAWTTAAERPLRLRVQEVDADDSATDVTETGSDVVDGRFSPDGAWLSFVSIASLPDGTTLRAVRAIPQAVPGLRVTVSDSGRYGRPDAHEWLGGRLAIRVGCGLDFFGPEPGWFVLRDVRLAPGDNRLVARATDPASGLASADSEAVLVTVPEEAFPDLEVAPEGILAAPPVPIAGQAVQLRVRVENRGDVDAGEADVLVRVADTAGDVVAESTATLPSVASGQSSWLLVPWTPATADTYTVRVEADPDGRVAEASEANNSAERALVVVAGEGLQADVGSDRASYPPLGTAHVTVRVTNTATPFAGAARTTVEDAAGGEVALLDERALSLDWGKTVSYSLDWSTGETPAGTYAFRLRVIATGETEPAAAGERAFDVEPGLDVRAGVTPEPTGVGEGARAAFDLLVENRSTNVTLDGATARLQVVPEGTSGPVAFETVRTLPSLATEATWTATDAWPAAQPPGRYTVRFEVTKDDVVLASATAILTVSPAAAEIRGTLAIAPANVLSGETTQAHLDVENQGAAAVAGYPLAVLLASGPEATVQLSVPAAVDLAAGESRQLTLPIATATLAPGPYVALLRAGASPASLDRDRLVVHGVVAPPSPHAPDDRARVATAHPSLVVNDASSPEGAPLTYEFGLFGDAGLTQAIPGASGVPETPSRTSWPVAAGLAEDTTYWWRARATDGFSTSAWSDVSAFTVDAANEPPTSPVPDTPAPDARVASRQPELTVRNAMDPEGQPLTYEFCLATDEALTQVVASGAGVAEGLGLTSWTVTTVLDEDAAYYWAARARTAGDAPEDLSPWSVPVRFRVDTVNGSPTAPLPLRPVGGADVTTPTPALVVANATDAEGDPLIYRFEIDTEPGFGSPGRLESSDLGPGPGETEWTLPEPLHENSLYYWRAHASDGNTETASAVASFFVDTVNEAPAAPVAIEPVDGRTVATVDPTLRVRNAADPEGDPLTYDFEVRKADGTVAAHAERVPSGSLETTWTVTTALHEDNAFTWSARAFDGELAGDWSSPATFRVNAVLEPPTAPAPLQPADGAVLGERRPSLLVENATSPEGLPLTYTFELDSVSPAGSQTPVERADEVPEGPSTTTWTPSLDLADGRYQWRARASDPQRDGPWSATRRFDVLVDPPPAAPTGLVAVAGDARVRLDWNASTEPDVTGYRVYRSTTAGGPYALVASVTSSHHDDLGLTNGVAYYYVVRAADAHGLSEASNEASARPAAPAWLVAEVRYDPAAVHGECLLGVAGSSHVLSPACSGNAGCPTWVLATLELPAGHDPGAIEAGSLRLLGSVAADPRYRKLVDVDRDGLRELQVRFAFDAVARHLAAGVNVATIVGRAGSSEVRGSSTIEVLALAATVRVTPRTLDQRSRGEDVQARITFAEGLPAADVAVSSVRLNGTVPVDRVVEARKNVLVVKFDRAAVVGVLPLGEDVEVRATGTLDGLPFAGVDHIQVTECGK